MTKIGTLTITFGLAAVTALTINGAAHAAAPKGPPASSYMIERPDPALQDRRSGAEKQKTAQQTRQTAQNALKR